MKPHDVLGKGDCQKGCWFYGLSKPFMAIWPLLVHTERSKHWHVWNLYVRWGRVQGTHCNNILVCEKHHKALLEIFESESDLDVREQEVTDEWLARTNNKMTVS
ncbi:MAG: hypothetical protein [Phage AS32]|nr:MAG: hypothetical protein [Phage AS32]